MENKPLHGIVTVKDGKITYLKNLSEWNSALVDKADPVEVLTKLAKAGWKLEGDYELKVCKEQAS
jgi:hypothetical protein